MYSAEELEELRAICQGAKPMTDGPLELIHLPSLSITMGEQEVATLEALLCLSPHEGYLTRLFLSQPLPKALNWSAKTILGRLWHTWSWQGVPSTHRLTQILAQHLKAFR